MSRQTVLSRRARGGRPAGLFALLLIIFLAVGVGATPSTEPPAWQAPRIVKNLLSQTADASFGNAVEMGGRLYFLAYNQGFVNDGYELWRTDGTPSGTVRLEAYQNWSPSPFYVLGDRLLFLASHPDYGTELWITDGTPGNAAPVGDLFPGPFDGNIANLTLAGDYLYFTAYDDVNQTELWRTDGTPAGTLRLTGPDLGLDVIIPHRLIDVDGTLFFFGQTSSGGNLLLKSNGTPAGTVLIKEADGSAFDGSMYVTGGLLYIAGRHIWRSDGTSDGTYVIHTFPDTHALEMGIAADTKLYLFQRDAVYRYELVQVVGDAVTQVTELPGFWGRMGTAGDRLFFVGIDSAHGDELWTSNGTAAGTNLVKDISPGDAGSMIETLVAVGDEVYFGADTSRDPWRRPLWRSDGTASGTVEVALGLPAGVNPRAEAVAEFDGRVLFAAADPDHGREPWMTQAGGAGAAFLADLNLLDTLSSMPKAFNFVDDTLYFWTTAGLWRSDGSAPGTALLVANIPDHRVVRQNEDEFGQAGKHLYFLIDDYPSNMVELWRTDGTPAGTLLVKVTAPMYRQEPVAQMAEVNGLLYFARFAQERHRKELWRSDGTPAGTSYIATPNGIPDPAESSEIAEITGAGALIYFVATDGLNGVELWCSDGTTAGTMMVKDIHPGPTGSDPTHLTAYGDRVYFFANDGTHGYELWRSDGTADGTVLAADVRRGAISSEPAELTAFQGALYFTAHDGMSGREMWRVTSGGISMLKDINPLGGSAAAELTPARDWLYFVAADGQAGMQPWKTDGTPGGTTRIAVLEYNDFAWPRNLASVDNTLFFSTVLHTEERFYYSDGTAAGTVSFADAFPTFYGYEYEHLTPAPGRLFFAAENLVYGNEPFMKVVSLAQTTPPLLYVGQGTAYTQYRLRLNFRPAAPVIIHFTSDDPAVEIAPASVAIQPENWNAWLTIGVRDAGDGQPGTREATLSQTFTSADAILDGVVTTVPLRIGWRLVYAPLVRR